MAGTRVVVFTLVALCSASVAHGQPTGFAGLLTGHIGAAAAGDVRDVTFISGISVAVLDPNGVGAELDIAHAGDFDRALFADSSLTTAVLNFIAVFPDETIRPYIVVGAGVLRVETTRVDGGGSTAPIEGVWSAGGGVLYMINDILGLRGDARYFRHFEPQADLGLSGDRRLDFWRTSVGVTFTWPIR